VPVGADRLICGRTCIASVNRNGTRLKNLLRDFLQKTSLHPVKQQSDHGSCALHAAHSR